MPKLEGIQFSLLVYTGRQSEQSEELAKELAIQEILKFLQLNTTIVIGRDVLQAEVNDYFEKEGYEIIISLGMTDYDHN